MVGGRVGWLRMTLADKSPAKDSGFDVVLIDTAGRMQDNEV
jgi:signal recognition particle GTPase